jgi:hypothetical protein
VIFTTLPSASPTRRDGFHRVVREPVRTPAQPKAPGPRPVVPTPPPPPPPPETIDVEGAFGRVSFQRKADGTFQVGGYSFALPERPEQPAVGHVSTMVALLLSDNGKYAGPAGAAKLFERFGITVEQLKALRAVRRRVGPDAGQSAQLADLFAAFDQVDEGPAKILAGNAVLKACADTRGEHVRENDEWVVRIRAVLSAKQWDDLMEAFDGNAL